MVKNLPVSAGDQGSIPGSGRSPGEGHGNPLQHSCLENPMDRGAWWAIIHEVTKSWTWLSDFFLSLTFTKEGSDFLWFWGPTVIFPTCLVSSSVTGSVHVSAPDCCLEHIFFFFFLKSLFNSPLPVKILFIALSSDLPFQWGLGSSPQQESYLLLSSCWCCYCWLQYCRSVQILLLQKIILNCGLHFIHLENRKLQ